MTTNAARIRELNETIRYTMWSVFRAETPLGPKPRAELSAEVEALVDDLAAKDVVVRGTYDVSGLRADADLMIWWHASSADALQEAYGAFRRTALGGHLAPVWSQMALHRPAEFNKSHLPAFLAGEPAQAYVCVYPFVRSYEWYLLPDDERRAMLAEHGQMARGYPDVRANTVAELRARRLRVDPRVRGRRAAPHRRPDARAARVAGPAGTCARRCRSSPAAAATWPTSSPTCRRTAVKLRAARFGEFDPATLYAILRLRADVFVVEQKSPYPDIDGRDTEPETAHLWFEEGGTPVAYLRVVRDGDEARIGRVCAAAGHRGTGLAARLMQAALDALEPGTPCVLDAQTQALGLYERFGFRISGDPYLEDGIEHVPMRLSTNR